VSEETPLKVIQTSVTWLIAVGPKERINQ